MLTLFYLFTLIFIWSNFYYLLNYKRLDLPLSERKINKKTDLIYYSIKVIFILWLIISLFLNPNIFIYSIIGLLLLRIPLYHMNKKIHSIVYKLTPPILIIILSIIFIDFITN
jgi:hypothetical protein